MNIGIVSKLSELADHSTTPIKESSAALLCSLFNSSNALFRKIVLLKKYNFMQSLLILFQIASDTVKMRIIGYYTLFCLLEMDDFIIPSVFLSEDFIRIITQDFNVNHFEMNVAIGKYICKLILCKYPDLSKDYIEMVRIISFF